MKTLIEYLNKLDRAEWGHKAVKYIEDLAYKYTKEIGNAQAYETIINIVRLWRDGKIGKTNMIVLLSDIEDLINEYKQQLDQVSRQA